MPELVLKENIALAPLTTFKIGGLAKYFVRVTTVEELLAALELARKNTWPILILAGGSNLIVSDRGFEGLVIAIEIMGWQIKGEELISAPSTTMAELVDTSIEKGLAGLEWAGGLPGSFGGAVRGNAGCFGAEMKDIITSVTSIHVDTRQMVTRGHDDSQFEYRGSYYKYHPEVIISATIRLRPGDKAELRLIADEHIQYRQARQPLEYPNAGSIFKNVPLEQVPERHLPLFADAIKNDPFLIVPSAKIIAVAGLKGMRVGDAQLSEKHSNYIVNLGQARASDVIVLINRIKTDIKSRYQIDLEVEPQLVGF